MATGGPSTSSGSGGDKRPPPGGRGAGRKRPDGAAPDWAAIREETEKEILHLQAIKKATEERLRQQDVRMARVSVEKKALLTALSAAKKEKEEKEEREKEENKQKDEKQKE